MRNILFALVVLFSFSCKAQTPVKSLYEDDTDITGAYYKDLYNDFDNFVGTWIYTNGSTSLTITLKKKLQVHRSESNGFNYYMDFIIGEYRYMENGVEKINTLPQLSSALTNPYSYNISGSVIVGPNSQYCLNCGPNDRKILLGFSDPTREIFAFEPEMIFQRADERGVQKLKLKFRTISGSLPKMSGEEPMYTSYTVPFGVYILVKQP